MDDDDTFLRVHIFWIGQRLVNLTNNKRHWKYLETKRNKMDLLGSILGTMEKPPSMSDTEKKKMKG